MSLGLERRLSASAETAGPHPRSLARTSMSLGLERRLSASAETAGPVRRSLARTSLSLGLERRLSASAETPGATRPGSLSLGGADSPRSPPALPAPPAHLCSADRKTYRSIISQWPTLTHRKRN